MRKFKALREKLINPQKKRKGNMFMITMVVMLIMLGTGVSLIWTAEFAMRYGRVAISSSKVYYSMENAAQVISQLFYIRLTEADFIYQGEAYRPRWEESNWVIPMVDYDGVNCIIDTEYWDDDLGMYVPVRYENFPEDFYNFLDEVSITETPNLPQSEDFLLELEDRVSDITNDIQVVVSTNPEVFGDVILESIELKGMDISKVRKQELPLATGRNTIVYPVIYYDNPVFIITVKKGERSVKAEFKIKTTVETVIESVSAAPYSTQLGIELNNQVLLGDMTDEEFFDWYSNNQEQTTKLFGVFADAFSYLFEWPGEYADLYNSQRINVSYYWQEAKDNFRNTYRGLGFGGTGVKVNDATLIDPSIGRVYLEVLDGDLALSPTQTVSLLRQAEIIEVRNGNFIIPPGHYETPNLKKVVVSGDIIFGIDPNIDGELEFAPSDVAGGGTFIPPIWHGELVKGSVGQNFSLNAGRDSAPVKWISTFGNIIIGCADGMDMEGSNYSYLNAFDGSIFVTQHGNIIFEVESNGGLLGSNSIFIAMDCTSPTCTKCEQGSGNIILAAKNRNVRMVHNGVIPQFYADNKIRLYGDSTFSKYWGVFVTPELEYAGFMAADHMTGIVIGNITTSSGSRVVNINDRVVPILLKGGIYDFFNVEYILSIPQVDLINYRVNTSPSLRFYGR